MAITIADWFGYDISCWNTEALDARQSEYCPFINDRCTKHLNDGSISGVCSMVTAREPAPIITCPNRLYGNDYAILSEVAEAAFGSGHRILHPSEFRSASHDGRNVVAFGQNYGGELRLPMRGRAGSYYVDWILAHISADGGLAEFVAIEVQAIDTTGTYRPEVQILREGTREIQRSKAGMNWENVNKRILPQIIYKGHVLRREPLCTKGLFFVCPSPVYQRILVRLGENLLPYNNLQPGSLTFMWY